MIAVKSPAVDDPACLRQAKEHFAIQELIAQLAVKTYHGGKVTGGGTGGRATGPLLKMTVFLYTSTTGIDGNTVAGDLTVLTGSVDAYAIDRANDGQWTSHSAPGFYTSTAADIGKAAYFGMEFVSLNWCALAAIIGAMNCLQHTTRSSSFAWNAKLSSLAAATFLQVGLLAGLLVAISAQQSLAQLFGARTLGRGSSSPSAQMSLAESRGALSGRGGRAAFQRPPSNANDFVGRDQLERESFIGLAQGNVTSVGGDTSAGLRRSRAQDILSRRRLNANVLQIQRSTGARGPTYSPRLEVQFTHRSSTTAPSDQQAQQTIAEIFATHNLSQVSLSVESGVATLRGKVASQDQRLLAAAVVNLEPAIWTVDNQLQIQSPLPIESESVNGAEQLTAPRSLNGPQ